MPRFLGDSIRRGEQGTGRDARRRRAPGAHLQPRQGLLPGGRHHQAGAGPLLPGGSRGCGARRVRPAHRPQALRGRHHRRRLLPEAGAGAPPGMGADRGAALPVRPHRPRAGGHRARAARLDDQPGQHRPESARRAHRPPGAPGRVAHRPRPVPGRPLGGRAAGRRGHARGAGGEPPGRVAQDQRLARHARLRPDRSPLGLRRSAPRGARRLARGRAARPGHATSKWWKEERVGVFLDYNQNAKDRTIAAAYSVRPNERALVSAPLTWDEVPACDPADFTLRTMPARLREVGDPAAGMDAHPGSLESLLEVSARHEAEGLGGDAPWPPHFARQRGEPRRVNPSRRRSGPSPTGRRRSTMPLIVIAQAKTEAEARAGLDRWRARHPRGGSVPHTGRRAGRRDARPPLGLDPHPRQPPPRARGRAPPAGTARPRLRSLRRMEPADRHSLTCSVAHPTLA